LRALWTDWSVEVRVLSGALGKAPLLAGFFVLRSDSQAEIAEELRMSPATMRSWISSGTLRAMRPGKRKLLVRRSELDRMLRGEDIY